MFINGEQNLQLSFMFVLIPTNCYCEPQQHLEIKWEYLTAWRCPWSAGEIIYIQIDDMEALLSHHHLVMVLFAVCFRRWRFNSWCKTCDKTISQCREIIAENAKTVANKSVLFVVEVHVIRVIIVEREQAVELLGSLKYIVSDNSSDEERCGICFDKSVAGSALMILHSFCYHPFHQNCITQWFQRC